MAPISAAVLLPAVAAALMAMAALQLSAAAAAAPPPAPAATKGQPGCSTTCGNVSVPYPFGFGPSHCYWPGLNLTCDTSDSHQTPRLLLGDGSLRVAEISLSNRTVRVMRAGFIINITGDGLTSPGWNGSLEFGHGFREHGYQLSARNELAVRGCNVMATISADIVGERNTKIVSGCASFCTLSDRGRYFKSDHEEVTDKVCSGTSGCCLAPLTSSGVPVRNGVQARWLYGGTGNHTVEQTLDEAVIVFVAQQGWVEKERPVDGFQEAPLLLDFAVKQGLPLHSEGNSKCSQDVQRMVCKSEHSECYPAYPGYGCKCKDGYDGNPYLAGGCQDVDECKLLGEDRLCFGVCSNTIGSYDCQCPQGTYGEPDVEGGCVDYNFNKADALSPTVVRGPIGCNTSCGDVSVPYPFGFGPSRCYWPGFNLTCDTRHSPPRLLLGGDGNGNGTLQVVHISLRNSTVHAIHHSSDTNMITVVDHTVINYTDLLADVRLPDIGEPYVLSTRNEFIVMSGWDMRANLHGEYRNSSSSSTSDSIINRAVCSSSGGDRGAGGPPPVPTQSHRGYCSGHDGCCHAPISAGSTPKRVEFKVLNKNISHHQYGNWSWNYALAFVSEVGLTDQWYKIVFNMFDLSIGYMSSPVVLQWAVKQGLSAPAAVNSGKCPSDVSSRLCKSENSDCRQENGGFTCHCSKGYDGNPYVANGCQGLIIGLSVASGPALLLIVLSIFFLLREFKQRKIKVQKQKYFKQNRGQLLQQLLSQKADIAERMIIPLDELAKATNNFDTAREIGGGGHGTVYKGILSDLHVVAIKKSKITMKKEIDEFINEVAILSQINHKNVVKLFGCCLETEVPLLVYEFIPNGTLYHHLHIEGQERSLSWSNRLRIATEIATSLAYLHSSVSIPIIHRDIKSSNILLDDTMTSKISDFGASRYIPIDNTGLTTRIQGTFGYLDPECFQTGRLTEKSDVYSFGIILVELLTRKKPTCSHLSNEYGGLVPHFLNLLASRNLDQIMDPQVLEEGGTEVQQVVMLAASCINIRGEERPTMRQVELTLEGLQQGSNKKYKKDDMVTEEFVNGSIRGYYPSWTSEGQRSEESSRRYSLEQEMMMSARYPR
ncbi:wall-associated receptor kinase 2-like [Miscanthus floridulus]|uniref:wall-associated receptor kinase 2-like n=1 Tax=Miscanthus floridulus TaxID=154761 RepID=UPI00345AE570